MTALVEIRALLRPIRRALKFDPDRFLRQVSGVIHVGANTGQERDLYEDYGLSVLWVEPIPEVFSQLKANIKGFKDQRALQALVAEVDGKEYEFHIANNDGESSSIFNFKHHKDIWPDVDFTATITLNSVTLASLLEKEGIDPAKYQALILDTQGSEMLVLLGSRPVLGYFEFIKLEVADFESYQGCCQLPAVNDFMKENGYREFSRNKFASRAEGGSYFDIVYRKRGKRPRKISGRGAGRRFPSSTANSDVEGTVSWR